MTNGNDYIEYVESQPDDQDQSEGHYYFTLAEFASVVQREGIKQVLKDLPKGIEEMLYWHYFMQVKPDFLNEEEPPF